jgi:hypothetical protein
MTKFEIDEILNMAIMTKTAHVLVEGIDDVAIYEELTRQSSSTCEIFSIEMIDGFSGGCSFVKKAIEELTVLAGPIALEEFIVGIVDRDASFYRKELAERPGLFILQNYSIESHFISDETVRKIIQKTTKLPASHSATHLLPANACVSLINELYYFSLEALKGAVDSTYNAEVGFSDSIGRRKDQFTMQKIMSKSASLDAFASSLNLNMSIECMRLFVKGKWLLTAFSEGLYNEIESLSSRCKKALIPQCKSCSANITAPCFYKAKDGYTHRTLYELAKDCIDNTELTYIRSMLASISLSAQTATIH